MNLQPYLDLDGRCDEAIEFYSKTLGAHVSMYMRFKDSPVPDMISKENANKVMHARLQIGGATMFMSDGHCNGAGKFEGISLSLDVPSVEEAEKIFTALSDGGKVKMPLGKTFFSPAFGMLTAKFGVAWMVHLKR
jgi:PhnB protein